MAPPALAQSAPATPKNLVTDPDAGVATWTKSTGATGYEIELQVGYGGTLVTLTPGDVATADFTSAPKATNCCVNGEGYRWRIRAFNGNGNSSWSDPWKEFIFGGISTIDLPLLPLTASFTWSVSYTHNRYFLTSTYSKPVRKGTCFINGGTINCPGGLVSLDILSYPSTYSIYLVVESGTLTYTTETVVLYVPADPGPPVGLTAPDNLSVDAERDTVSWDAVSGATQYGLRIEQGGSEIVNVSTSSTSSELSDPISHHATTVKVNACYDTARTICGVDAVLELAGIAPATPSSFRVDPATGSASWTKSTGASHYRVQLREVTGVGYGGTVTLNLGDVDSLNFITAAGSYCCVNGVSYQTRILARNSYGESAYTDPWLEFEYTGVTTSAPPASPGQPSRPGGSGDSSGSSRVEPDTTTRDPANLPIPAQDHSNLPAGAEVHSETPWIQFNEVREAGIGVRSILDRGARQAIDVWGPMGVEAEICFDGVGSLLLLDAAYAPRLETPLVSYLRLDGKTCAQLDRAGTVVLMPGEPTHVVVPTATPPAPSLSGGAPVVTADGLIVDDPTTAVALANCHVGSFHVLNLRERPAGRILGWFHGDMTRALARTPNWFQIEYNGMVGWVSGHYAIVNGDCG